MDRKLKSLFDKMGIEKTSDNFTFLVMNKIETGFVKIPARTSYWKKYRFMSGYIIALILVIPLSIPAVRYLSGLRLQTVDFDFGLIYEWFNPIFNSITIDPVTGGIVLSALILITILFFVLEDFSPFGRKSLQQGK